MNRIRQETLPETALLRRNATGANYTDCFVLDVPQPVPLSRLLLAFYTTWLFRMERTVLTLAARPSTDRQALALASAESETFAAWQVEARAADQIHLCDMTGRTRSWFMVAGRPDGLSGTRLFFGSAIVAVPDRHGGPMTIGPLFRALTGAHVFYSRALLRAAASRLGRLPEGQGATAFRS